MSYTEQLADYFARLELSDLPEPLQRLRRVLLRRDGGDRVMAQVLMAVPTHGLEAVLVAVDLVLETGRPVSSTYSTCWHGSRRGRHRNRSRRV